MDIPAEQQSGLPPREQLVLMQQLKIRSCMNSIDAHVQSHEVDPVSGMSAKVHSAIPDSDDSSCSVDSVDLVSIAGVSRRAELLNPPGNCHDGLDAALKQRIVRRRIEAGDLRESRRNALSAAIEKRRGSSVDSEVVALFAQVPPEFASSLKVAADLSYASFLPQSGESQDKIRDGFHLVMLKTADGKTDRFLVRL